MNNDPPGSFFSPQSDVVFICSYVFRFGDDPRFICDHLEIWRSNALLIARFDRGTAIAT
jgi:hypothetical protein